MKTVSATSIQDYRKCPRFYKYRYVDRLKVPPSPNMVSGSVVHRVIEDWLGENIDRSIPVEAYVQGLLIMEFGHHDDAWGQAKKYLPGVMRALSKVPEWVWERTWHVEQLMEWEYRDVCCAGCMGTGTGTAHTPVCKAVTVRMKPDLWSEHDSIIDIVEFKTTERNPLDYLLFNPQHWYYGVALAQEHPDTFIRFRYVCLPTTTKRAVEHIPWAFTVNALAQAREELVQGATNTGSADWRNRGFWCSTCEFKELCAVALTGGDEEGMIEEMKEASSVSAR